MTTNNYQPIKPGQNLIYEQGTNNLVGIQNPNANGADLNLGASSGSSLVGFIQAGTGAVARTAQSKMREEVSVKDFGAVGDGVTDDSAAFAAALAYANEQAYSASTHGYEIAVARMCIPAGNYYLSAGLTVSALRCEIIGDGREQVLIQIPSGQYFLTITSGISNSKVSGISFQGGKGALANTYTGTNVNGVWEISDNNFSNYTECAVGTLAADFPYIKVKNNIFYGTTTSKGVAFAGFADLSEIEGNSFLLNRYHVKIAKGGNNVKIFNNDFIRFADGGGSPALTDIWITASGAQANSGSGLLVLGNKFGNENLNVADYRVLVANQESGGTNYFDKNNATTVSTNYSIGPRFKDNYVSSIAGFTHGFIYSYTPNIRSYNVSNFWDVTLPYVIQFDPVVTVPDDRVQDTNVIDISGVVDPFELQFPPVSNASGIASVNDPFGLLSGSSSFVQQYDSGVDPGATDLWTTASSGVNQFTLSNATRASATDSTGDADAATITYTSSAGRVYGYLAATTSGRNAFVEIELKRAASNPLTGAYIIVKLDTGEILFKRAVYVPTAWQRFRFNWVPRVSSSVASLHILPIGYSAGVTDQILIGRARVYHAAEPTYFSSRSLQARKTFDWPSIANAASSTTTVTVTGAELGDFALASMSGTVSGLSITAYVSAADTVTVVAANLTGGAVDLASGTLRVKVIKSVNYQP